MIPPSDLTGILKFVGRFRAPVLFLVLLVCASTVLVMAFERIFCRFGPGEGLELDQSRCMKGSAYTVIIEVSSSN